MNDDSINRQAAIRTVKTIYKMCDTGDIRDYRDMLVEAFEALPSAQPDLSEAYSKAVFTWLTNYQIRAAELKGRYTPYEVLSWVINDWRKENG